MRRLSSAILFTGFILAAAGCGPKKSFEGPTVDAFVGRLQHDGKPVSFASGETVELRLMHETAQSFGIPIQADGSFKIGWMPIGKYSATLIQEGKKEKGPGTKRYNVPGGLTIENGKTEYVVELGKGWKP